MKMIEFPGTERMEDRYNATTQAAPVAALEAQVDRNAGCQ